MSSGSGCPWTNRTAGANNTDSGAAAAAGGSLSDAQTQLLNTRTVNIVLVYSFAPAWLRCVGLTLCSTPILSALPVSPDTYLYGEGAMSFKASYATRADAGNALTIGTSAASAASALLLKSFALVETSPTPVGAAATTTATAPIKEEISDFYPLLLAVRASYDTSQGNKLLFFCFRWIVLVYLRFEF